MRSPRALLVVAGALLLGCCVRQERAGKAAGAPSIRPPAVAGQFYPADPAELRRAVSELLAAAAGDAVAPEPERSVIGLVVPHAGYEYSGAIAARAFAALRGERYDAVLLLGSPHRVPLRGASVFTGGGFATPLGTARVEQELARSIASSGPLFSADAAPHAPEHSLEVELPFLQTLLGDPAIVPVLIMAEPEDLRSIAEALVRVLSSYRASGRRVLVVVSTDLAHYPSREDAEASDREMLAALCSLEEARLLETNERLLQKGTPNLACTMCGLDAAYVGMIVARKLGATEGRIEQSGTSADAGAPATNGVVGYGAVSFLGAPRLPATSASRFGPLGAGEQEYLLALARRSIAESLSRAPTTEAGPPAPYRGPLEEPRGVFVTLSLDGRLRGCIGRHEPETPLWRTVREVALASAFEDPRFPPLSESELRSVRIELSVFLTPLIPLSSAEQYVPGRHGILLRVGARGATFLPEVPLKQGWDRLQTLGELCRKAGLPADAWRRADARLLVYETQVFGEAEGGR